MFRLIAEDIQGTHVLINSHGLDLSTDKSMAKKWQTLTEANIDIKIIDGSEYFASE